MLNNDLFGNSTIVKDNIDRGTLSKQLFSILNHISLEDFIKMITNNFEEVIEYARLSNGEKCCQKTSLLFNPHRLDTKTKSSSKSIFDALKTENFCNGLARAVLFKKDKVKELLYQVLQLGINGIQYVNEFPPHIAVKLLNDYNLDADSKIIDPCAGWGVE